MTKKVDKEKNFSLSLSLMNKDLNWKSLTENWITLKIWDGVKNEKFYYCGGSFKNVKFGREGSCIKPIYKGTA